MHRSKDEVIKLYTRNKEEQSTNEWVARLPCSCPVTDMNGDGKSSGQYDSAEGLLGEPEDVVEHDTRLPDTLQFSSRILFDYRMKWTSSANCDFYVFTSICLLKFFQKSNKGENWTEKTENTADSMLLCWLLTVDCCLEKGCVSKTHHNIPP